MDDDCGGSAAVDDDRQEGRADCEAAGRLIFANGSAHKQSSKSSHVEEGSSHAQAYTSCYAQAKRAIRTNKIRNPSTRSSSTKEH